MAGLREESRGEESGPTPSDRHVPVHYQMLLLRPTLGGAWSPMTRWCQVPCPCPQSEGPRDNGIPKGERGQRPVAEMPVTPGDPTRNRARTIRWGTPHRHPLDTLSHLDHATCQQRFGQPPISTEETEKEQASLEANHFATRPWKHNRVKG